MTVVTRKRIYSFVLRAGGGAHRVVFKVRFTYPDDEADAKFMAKAEAMAAFPNKRAAENSTTRNFDYSYKGHVTVKPQIVFDDGTKTYFRFSGDVPGIFLVNADRTETLVNYRREGEIVVVDKTAGQWTLRNGDDTACVFNMRAKSRTGAGFNRKRHPALFAGAARARRQSAHAHPERRDLILQTRRDGEINGRF